MLRLLSLDSPLLPKWVWLSVMAQTVAITCGEVMQKKKIWEWKKYW
jgi:hypothetical protein